MPWSCVAGASERRGISRRAWGVVRADGGWQSLGAVDERHLGELAAWPGLFELTAPGLRLTVNEPERSRALARVNARLREQGLIRAWRDEDFALLDDEGQRWAVIERASARFWGALTLGAHCNGYQADAQGRPQALWIARRAWNKATDPGKLDNLIGGGVGLGQTPHQALLREAWEEAGLGAEVLAGLRPGRVIALNCEIAEGLQCEWLYVWDLALPTGVVPINQDGEVAEHRLMPVDEALAHAAAGDMTVDAALATLDFALRHRLLKPAEQARLAEAMQPLWVSPEQASRLHERVGA